MITRYVEFNIVCDECSVDGCNVNMWYWVPNPTQKEWGRQMPASTNGVRDMQRIAKRFGWKRIKGKDFCPKCIDKINREKTKNSA